MVEKMMLKTKLKQMRQHTPIEYFICTIFYQKHGDETLDLSNERVHDFLDSIAHSCKEMLIQCHFEGSEGDCSEIFIPVITDDGQCCGFNVMPEHVMFRNSDYHSSAEEKERWANWDMQNGYSHTPNKGEPDCEMKEGTHQKVHKRAATSECATEDGGPPR